MAIVTLKASRLSAVHPLGILALALGVLPLSAPAFAQITAPSYAMCRLDSIYPAGGRAGETVKVEFEGEQGGLQFPKAVLIEGPPGITVGAIKPLDINRIEAELIIAPDAVPGRRAVRVVSEQSGLTNLAWFIVGKLPEQCETEPNNALPKAETVTLPVTLNGRIQAAPDVDCYKFTATAGQKLVAAVMSHALDAHGQYKDYGIVDCQLELLDSTGKIVAEAQDTLGLDPVIEYPVPRDGEYAVRIQLMGYRGFPQAVYRLTVGEVPIPYAAFPPGGRRGETANVRLFGWNLPADAGRSVTLNQPRWPYEWVTVGGDLDSGRDVPLHIGEVPEALEREPNNQRPEATPLRVPCIINGQFGDDRDDDWYRLELSTLQPVWIETFAQRFLRAPVDSVLQIYDSEGKLLQEADDGVTDAGYEQFHDFRTPDSRLTFTPKAPGVYFVKVVEANRVHGPRAVYRLHCKIAEPDFELIQFPDVMPIWGSGSTASLLVKVERQSGLDADIELAVEGLSPGWTSSRHTNTWKSPQNITYYTTKQFLTITAPADAAPGTLSEFRVVGRAKVGERMLERTASPLTLYFTSDTGFFRLRPVSRAVVARPQGPTLAAEALEITMTLGGTAQIPVRVLDFGDAKEISVNANVCSNGVASSWGSPQSLPIVDGKITFPLQVPEGCSAGLYALVIARSWGADIRVGMPGPSTQTIKLIVLPKPT